jgi:hypothetical protein
MRVALCLSGQPRYLERGFEALSNTFLKNYNVDVFSHIWFDKSLAGQDVKLCLQYNRRIKWEENADKMLLKYYNPKKYMFEPPREFSVKGLEGANFELISSDPGRILSMFYSIKQANLLKMQYEQENNFKYDLVIRARTDLIIQNMSLDLNNIDQTKIYCYGTNHYEMFRPDIEICNDQLAIGSSKNIDVYSSLYDKIEYYWINDRPWSMVGERILAHHLIKSNIDTYCCKANEMYVDLIKE